MDASNSDHRRFAMLLESSTGLPHRPIFERNYEGLFSALRNANFEIIEDADLAAHDSTRISANQVLIPWFTALEAAFSHQRTVWASDDGGSRGQFGSLSKNAAVMLVQAGKLDVR